MRSRLGSESGGEDNGLAQKQNARGAPGHSARFARERSLEAAGAAPGGLDDAVEIGIGKRWGGQWSCPKAKCPRRARAFGKVREGAEFRSGGRGAGRPGRCGRDWDRKAVGRTMVLPKSKMPAARPGIRQGSRGSGV